MAERSVSGGGSGSANAAGGGNERPRGSSRGPNAGCEAKDPAGLVLRGVTVNYPGTRGAPAVRAVDAVSLHVPRGTTTALLGASGSGKSTLLRAIAGLEPLRAGTITFDGEDITRVPVHRRNFGLMFQDGQLFAHLNVRGNIEYGLVARRVPRGARARRVDELLDLVGLAGYADRDVATLSGGQRQRVALARSLAPTPRLLLLDEPLSALDADLRGRLAAELRDILRATGTTAVFVTHDRAEADLVADATVLIENGRLI
ncbi:ABC transporter ATP-binding protein [Rarobacter incanus]|uniref:Thiamine transport system ATP-binding protein n=1 Tax=Rarobacter incanus TaxID=153494 RepID=A0A542SPF0_9MICO|nr:ABC transporter ATP-binding protein [Rarobacter incanus]TQK76501.1 thiamine transport system ATP-binding protein [Rarobacter incanus]